MEDKLQENRTRYPVIHWYRTRTNGRYMTLTHDFRLSNALFYHCDLLFGHDMAFRL